MSIDINNRTKGIWAVKKSKSKPGFNVVGTALGGKYKIARCPYTILGSLEYFDKEEAEANAAFIVTACNNYEKLVKALKIAQLQMMRARAILRETGRGNWEMLSTDFITHIFNSIEKAEQQ